MTEWPPEADADAFYGNPRAHGGSYDPLWARGNLVHVACPWQLHMGPHQPVPFVTIHKKCAESLTRALAAAWERIGRSQEAAAAKGYAVFSGSFNFRPIRGSSRISMHAYGAAIDWDAPDNPMGTGHLRHRFTDDDPLIAAFKAEGWRWGGDYCSRHDYMHVEACRQSAPDPKLHFIFNNTHRAVDPAAAGARVSFNRRPTISERKII